MVPKSLDSITKDLMDKFFRTCRDYEKAYRGHDATNVEDAMQVYKSHVQYSNCVYMYICVCIILCENQLKPD